MYGEKTYLIRSSSKRVKVDYYKYPTRQVATAEIHGYGEAKNPYFAVTLRSYTHNHHMYGGGADHEFIAKHFPVFRPYLKWHSTHTNGPTHYLANGLYHLEQGNFDAFHRTVLWGEVESDKEKGSFLNEVMILIKIGLDMESEYMKKWICKDNAEMMRPYLIERLPSLMAHFREDMKTLFGQDIYELLESEK
jgi:hypothetical protein